MNINFKFLLLGTSLSLIPSLTQAQCVATTDCATLGYTEKSCPDGKGIRCPFGTTYACCSDNCVKNGFKYECKGTGYASGVGQTCNNKYTSCTCAEGYEWKDGRCEKIPGPILGQCTGYVKNCKIADILNSDGTCTKDKVSGKTPLGFVVAIKGNCGYAMTASRIRDSIEWSVKTGSTGAFQSEYWEEAIKDFNVSGNMTKIIQKANGDSTRYPAAWAALNYAPSAAPTSKGKWMLLTAGILNSLYKNLNVIDNTIYKIGGRQLTGSRENIWSSSESSSGGAWAFDYTCPDGVCSINKTNANSVRSVRPVIAF